MQIDLEPKSLSNLQTGPVLQQTSYWGQVKKIQGWNCKAFYINLKNRTTTIRNISKDLLVVSRSIGDNAELAYIPYGPNILPQQENRGLLLEELSENLRRYLSKNCILIRYDLPWRSPWMQEADCYDENGQWLGPPEPRVREFRMNFGTREWNLRKAPSDSLPSSTLYIDLKKSEEELLAKMKPKTRYNINLSRRKSVVVREASIEELSVWYDLYCQTAERNRITLHSIDYFISLLKVKEQYHHPDIQTHLLLAEVAGEAVAGMFLVISGNQATYLYGASSNNCRNYMGTYSLQWKAICLARKAGCTQYDMFGVSQLPHPSHPMYGLYRFKSGFGGSFLHRQGCWDYPLNEKTYSGFISSELSMTGYHL